MNQDKIICNKSDLTAVADTIRSKLGVTDTYYVSELSDAIERIPTGTQLPTLTNPGTSSDLLSGKELIDQSGNVVTGTIATKAAATITPGTTDQTISANTYLTGAQTVKGDANLIASNIKSGVSIFGVTGTASGGGGGGSNKAPYTLTLNGSSNFFQEIMYVNSNFETSSTGKISFPYVLEMYSPSFAIFLTSSSFIPLTFSNCTGDGMWSYSGNTAANRSFRACMVTDFHSATVTFPASCFLPDALISLADGTKKQIKDLTYDDKLLVWNFDEGKFDSAPICWLTRSGLMNDHYYKLTFSDGTILKTTGQNSNHKVYNVDERYFKGVNKTKIGDRIFSKNGIVTVVNKEYIEEEVEYYNLITTRTINCFVEGILTSDRYGNLYPIDENMVYIKDGVKIRPYSEFEAIGIKRYWYDTLRLGEVSGTVNETKNYIDKLECQMLTPPGYNELQ